MGSLAGWRRPGVAQPRPLRPAAQVGDAQLAWTEQALLQGARAHGFDTGLWALGRVARVVKRLTGISLPSSSVWRLLHQRLGWTVQRPERKAKERDEEAIARFIAYEWPRIKRGPTRNPPGLSSPTNPPSR